MNRHSTLFHPFETGDLPLPEAGSRLLFFGAEPDFRLPEGFGATLACVQGFRPAFLQLQRRGVAVSPRAQGASHDGALVLCDRHRGRNELLIAEAIERVRPGGLIVVAGGKEDGVASLRKRIGELLRIEGHLSKHHGVAFWFRREQESEAAVSPLRANHPPVRVADRFQTAPGMFSHDRVDAGSRLLAGQLPDDIKGAVADFGAGWGYLAVVLAERYPAIRSLDLYEAEFDAVEAARANLPDPRANFFWHDLLSEPVTRHYNWIVMNPPFHQGRAADPGIGGGMIRAAARALGKGGQLVMVANSHLPYEAALYANFTETREICREGGFKVLTARR